MRTPNHTILLALLLLGACGKEYPSDRVEAELTDSALRAEAAASGSIGSSAPPIDVAAVQQVADSLDKRLRQVRRLTLGERRRLRRDVNATQVARAQQLGIRRTATVDDLVAREAVVRLPERGEHFVLYRLDYSAPYVTPSTARLLEEIGERFRAKLDSLQAPPVRLVITSALRTPENQAKLRKRNRNASRTVSAHEFGTTVDIAYRRFASTVDHPMADSIIARRANKRSAEMEAILGRVLLELRAQGKLLVMMERRQTVYHITLARRMK